MVRSLSEILEKRFLSVSLHSLLEKGTLREVIVQFEKQKSSFVNAVTLKSHSFESKDEQ